MNHDLISHPRMRDLAARLNEPLHHAVGIVEMLHHYTSEYCPRGRVGKFSDHDLARAVQWRKSPEVLIRSLLDSRWIEVDPQHRLVLCRVFGSGSKRPTIPAATRRAVLSVGVCAICDSSERPTVDHIKPVCKGGTDDIENLQRLCLPCNLSKSSKWIEGNCGQQKRPHA